MRAKEVYRKIPGLVMLLVGVSAAAFLVGLFGLAMWNFAGRDVLRAITPAKFFVLTAALLIAMFFAKEIAAWSNKNAELLGKATAVSLLGGFVGLLGIEAIVRVGNWIVPRFFSARAPSGIEAYLACALSAAVAVMWILKTTQEPNP